MKLRKLSYGNIIDLYYLNYLFIKCDHEFQFINSDKLRAGILGVLVRIRGQWS